ncbi:MAG: glycosyltransferase family 2 protein [Chloroflexi bacterium]|nr:glycosyltransferase family 2 protein [Chloroflexota bacterium]
MPKVSIIVPCYNEQPTIHKLLAAVKEQTYPLEEMEVIIADGLSTDGTRGEVEAFTLAHPSLAVRIVDNVKRSIPAGLNRAIEAAGGEYLVRLDAHSIPYPDYVARCVSALQAGRGDNVGGVWEILPGGEGWMARSIAVAAAHPIGAGDARYRVGGAAQAVDTVPFGAYRRSLATRLGGYDETLLTNEDYEFNVRLRQTGGVVWMEPAIRAQYYARAHLKELFRQYWRYGYWKAQMLRRHPSTLRWRQALPPLFVLSLIGLALIGFWLPAAHVLLAVEAAGYLAILLLAGVQTALRRGEAGLVIGLPLAFLTMHLAWGGSFLWGWAAQAARRRHG